MYGDTRDTLDPIGALGGKVVSILSILAMGLKERLLKNRSRYSYFPRGVIRSRRMGTLGITILIRGTIKTRHDKNLLGNFKQVEPDIKCLTRPTFNIKNPCFKKLSKNQIVLVIESVPKFALPLRGIILAYKTFLEAWVALVCIPIANALGKM